MPSVVSHLISERVRGFGFFLLRLLWSSGLKAPILESWVSAFEWGISNFYFIFENVMIFYCNGKEKENVWKFFCNLTESYRFRVEFVHYIVSGVGLVAAGAEAADQYLLESGGIYSVSTSISLAGVLKEAGFYLFHIIVIPYALQFLVRKCNCSIICLFY